MTWDFRAEARVVRAAPGGGQTLDNRWLQKWVAAAPSLFPACYLQGTAQLCRVPPGLNARAATGSRPTAQAATAPTALGGRRPVDRPSSVPAWVSPAAPASGGAQRR